MKFIVFIFCATLLMSCDSQEGKYIRYSISGTAIEAKILYIDNGINIETIETLPWSKDIFIDDGDLVGISAFNKSEGKMNVRIFFMGNDGLWKVYKTGTSETFIMLKGIINSIL